MNKKYNLHIVILSFILLINGCFQIERNEKFNFVAMSLVLVIELIIIFVINNIHEFIINNNNEIKNIKYKIYFMLKKEDSQIDKVNEILLLNYKESILTDLKKIINVKVKNIYQLSYEELKEEINKLNLLKNKHFDRVTKKKIKKLMSDYENYFIFEILSEYETGNLIMNKEFRAIDLIINIISLAISIFTLIDLSSYIKDNIEMFVMMIVFVVLFAIYFAMEKMFIKNKVLEYYKTQYKFLDEGIKQHKEKIENN